MDKEKWRGKRDRSEKDRWKGRQWKCTWWKEQKTKGTNKWENDSRLCLQSAGRAEQSQDEGIHWWRWKGLQGRLDPFWSSASSHKMTLPLLSVTHTSHLCLWMGVCTSAYAEANVTQQRTPKVKWSSLPFTEAVQPIPCRLSSNPRIYAYRFGEMADARV